jgi:type VI secretion system secreted protein VgrG
LERLQIFVATKDELSVRRFSVTEVLSSFFDVTLLAMSKNDDIDLEGVVGKPAAFAINHGIVHLTTPLRVWSGTCVHIEQQQAEIKGLSTYFLRIAPTLWLLTQRSINRIFQHLSVPDIADKVLADWGIKPIKKLSKEHKKLEYCVQFGESDYAFFSRLMEQEGITFHFEFDPEKGPELVLADQPHLGPQRPGAPIHYVDSPNREAEREFVTKVQLGHSVRPGRVVLRDYDFRKKADFPFLGKSKVMPAPEAFYEQYHYTPGVSLVEPGKSEGEATPVADDKGVARHEEPIAEARAQRTLEAERRFKRRITFQTNCIDLAPGVIFSMARHDHKELKDDKKILVSEMHLEGTHDGEWRFTGEAVFGGPDNPYQPALKTPKPKIHGVQSAIVVGPKGEEIYTDEFGRVRVQFHWDRDHSRDENSSCWMRVSQAWAGSGYGTMMIPRVGHEVLVGFFEGDPDQPVVVGRVYNAKMQVPYKLPDTKTQSTWRSDTSPGSGGYNEILIEDKKGQEFVYVQAQLDMQRLVKHDETERTGKHRYLYVGDSRRTVVAKVDATLVANKYSLQMIKPPSEADMKILPQKKPDVTPRPTRIDMIDEKIVVTTGDATAQLKGSDATFEAKGDIRFKSKGGDIIFEGGPFIKVNC